MPAAPSLVPSRAHARRARAASAALALRDLGAVVAAAAAPLSIAISQSALGLALAATVAAWLAGRRPARTGLEVPAALLAGWALLMVPFSGDPEQSLTYLRRFYLLAAVWIFASAGAGRPWMRAAVLGALAAGAAALAGYGLWQLAAGSAGRYDPATGQLAGRVTLTQGYMTGGGVLMLAGLVLLAFAAAPLGPRRPGRRGWPRPMAARVALGAAVAAVAAALVLTMTRSAWLGFAAGAAVVLGLRRGRMLVPAAGLALAVALLLPGAYRERLVSTFDPGHRHNVQRVLMWQTGWQILRDHPLTGVGDHDLKETYRSYHRGEDVEVQGHLHSNLIQFAAIWGAPGLLLGSLLLFAPPVLLWRRWRGARGAAEADDGPAAAGAGWALAGLAAWTGFFMAGLFEWNFGDAEVALLLWLVIGMGLAPWHPPAGGKSAG